MKRIIVELDDLLMVEAAVIAKQQGKSLDDVVGTALREYVEANVQPPNLPFIGMFEGDGRPSDPEDLDRELVESGDPHRDWSHDPGDVRAEGRRHVGS